MDNANRKQMEQDVYDQKIQQERRTFGDYFDNDLERILWGYEFLPDLQRWGEQYLNNKKVLVLGASKKDVALVNRFTSQITAIDISKEMIRKIKELYPDVKTVVGDAEKMEGIQGKFEVVFCKSILHHLHPIEAVLERIVSLLKKDGVLFIASEPGYHHPLAFLGRKYLPSREHTPGEKAFDFFMFERQLGKDFISVQKQYYFFLSLGLVILPVRLPFLKPVCEWLLKPALWVEKGLRKVPGFKRYYWILGGVWGKK